MQCLNLSVFESSLSAVCNSGKKKNKAASDAINNSTFTCLVKVDESRGRLQSTRFPQGRTLFVSNAFPYFCLASYEKLFESMFPQNPKLESVYLNKDIALYCGSGEGLEDASTLSSSEFIGWGVTLHFIFDSEISIPKYLSLKKFTFNPPCEPIAKLPDLKCLTNAQLTEKINNYMNQFDMQEKRVRNEVEKITNEPDEDGFVTVTRHHKKNVNRDQSGTTVLAISSGRLALSSEEQKKKDSSKTRVDFYRFQMREAKREKLADLRRKFMEDKEKLVKMKESRKFRPY